MIQMKRAYEPAVKADGYRVLIDRLWPRGIRKADFQMDEWAKQLAPSATLRRDFGHKPEHWKEFQSRYRAELRSTEAREKLEELAWRARRGTVTLVYSAKDEAHNDAVVLREIIERKLAGPKQKAA
jgi:uncharacterized protein YeaO (DUF488 family)